MAEHPDIIAVEINLQSCKNRCRNNELEDTALSISKIIDQLVMPSDTAIATELSGLRALPSEAIAHELRKRSHQVSVQPNISRSIQYAKQISGPDSTILIVGSLYAASEARAFELELTNETKEKTR